MASRDETRGPPDRRQAIGLAVALSAVVAALSLFWSASEAHYRACLRKVEVKYPAVPVSAFVGRNTANVGPLKVSFAQERSRAADDCGRFF